MARGVRVLLDQIAALEKQTAVALQSLHGVRARTSRVLAATSAFTQLDGEAGSLGRQVRALVSLTHVDADSLDRSYFDRELARLRATLNELRVRYSPELTYAAESAPAPRPAPSPPKRWWRVWR